MDETRVQSTKLSSETPVFFPPHRRRHLRSETVRTLLRIFSQCYDDSCASRNIEPGLVTENGSSESWQQTEDRVSQPPELASEKVPEVSLNGDNEGSVGGGGFSEMSIDQIVELMGLEENEDSLSKKDVNLGSFSEQLLINELENIVQGNEDVGCENNAKPLKDQLIRDQSGVSPSTKGKHVTFDLSENLSQILASSDNIEDSGRAIPMESEDGDQSLLKIDPTSDNSVVSMREGIEVAENHPTLVSEEIIELAEINTIADVSILGKKIENELSPTAKDKDLEDIVCDDDMVVIGNPMTDVMEDGEISGGYNIDDISMDMLLKDSEMQNKEVNNEPIKSSIDDRNKLFCDDANERDSKNSFFRFDAVDKTNNLGGLWESERKKTVTIHDVNLHEKTLVEANNRLMKTQKIKKNVEVHCKKKRGPLTEEKRSRRNAKKRKKRAEKNQQLGVKRLKLHTISKPKTIQYCRHYLHGRCHEGNECKFSHDVVPLTKSKPCSHFACHSCMKGDDCPFDHQLSKYPCSNFASKGFCSRGDDCLFSHKILSEEDTAITPNSIEPAKKSASLVAGSTSMKQQSNDGASRQTSNVTSFSKMHSYNITKKALNDSVLKQSELSAKVTSLLSVENPPLFDKLKQQNMLPGGNAEVKATVQYSNEVLNKTPPVVTPKGINFLSFRRAQQDDLSRGRSTSSFPSGDNRVKLSPSDNSNALNDSIPGLFSDSTPKGIQPAVAPKGINFLSFGRVQRDDLSGSKLAGLFTSGDNSVKLSTIESNIPNQYSLAPFSDSTTKGIQSSVVQKGISFISSGNTPTKMLNQASSASISILTPKGIQPVVLNGVNFLSIRKTPIDDPANKGKIKLILDGSDGHDGRAKVQQNAPDEPLKSNSSALPSSPISLTQSGRSTSKIYTDTPDSVQKTLFSTFAFAAKYESRMKLNQSSHAPVGGKESDNEGTVGGSQDNSSKSLTCGVLV